MSLSEILRKFRQPGRRKIETALYADWEDVISMNKASQIIVPAKRCIGVEHLIRNRWKQEMEVRKTSSLRCGTQVYINSFLAVLPFMGNSEIITNAYDLLLSLDFLDPKTPSKILNVDDALMIGGAMVDSRVTNRYIAYIEGPVIRNDEENSAFRADESLKEVHEEERKKVVLVVQCLQKTLISCDSKPCHTDPIARLLISLRRRYVLDGLESSIALHIANNIDHIKPSTYTYEALVSCLQVARNNDGNEGVCLMEQMWKTISHISSFYSINSFCDLSIEELGSLLVSTLQLYKEFSYRDDYLLLLILRELNIQSTTCSYAKGLVDLVLKDTNVTEFMKDVTLRV